MKTHIKTDHYFKYFFNKLKKLACILFISALTLHISESYADISRATLIEKVNNAIKSVSRQKSILVDPKITNEIISDAETFTLNFCTKDTSNCEFISSKEVLVSILIEYFQDLNHKPQYIETVASRLARHVGINMADAGWPDKRINQIGIIRFPDSLAGSEITLVTATSTVDLGQAGEIIFVQPGEQRLRAKFNDGRVIDGVVKSTIRSEGTWSVAAPSESLLGDNIDPDLSLYCNEEQNKIENAPFINPPLGPFNYGRGKIFESPDETRKNTVPAAHQPGLEIKISDQTKHCSKECLNDITASFIQSIAIWRSGFSRCTGNSLVVLKFDNTIWIDSRAASRLRDASSMISDIDYDLSNIQPNEIQHYVHAPSFWQSGSFIVGYERLDKNDLLKNTLCNLPNLTDTKWITLAQHYICNKVAIEPMGLAPELEITKGWTSCGEGAIACAIPGGKIQITDKFSYWIRNDLVSQIFNGEIEGVDYDINTVLLHEVGHWFGLRHPETMSLDYKDVMQGTIDSNHNCVAPQSLTMLNNATDLRWPCRAKENQGLMSPIKLTSGETAP